MAKNIQHVIPDLHGGWSVKKDGATRALRRFDKKRDAIMYGRTISKNQKSQFVIHRLDGTVDRKESYEDDLSVLLDTLK